jgi:hypothetical protein
MTEPQSPAATAATLAAFVDTLIPGDDLFPAASTVGTQGHLADRLRALVGPDAVAEAVSPLDADGRPFVSLSPEERVAAVRRLESDEPEQFALLRSTTYYAYYASPTVVECIRALGFVYNHAPQPEGYELPPFDPAPGADAPLHPRGHYKRTDEMTPIDISGLSVLREGGTADG